VPAPPVGSVELTTSPKASTATHRPADAHETLSSAGSGGWLSIRVGEDQLSGEAASAGPASTRKHPPSMIERSPTNHNTYAVRRKPQTASSSQPRTRARTA
jgi:hypothetical protein